jgi:hypothetical protein
MLQFLRLKIWTLPWNWNHLIEGIKLVNCQFWVRLVKINHWIKVHSGKILHFIGSHYFYHYSNYIIQCTFGQRTANVLLVLFKNSAVFRRYLNWKYWIFICVPRVLGNKNYSSEPYLIMRQTAHSRIYHLTFKTQQILNLL